MNILDEQFKKGYFQYLCDVVKPRHIDIPLMTFLYKKPFTWTIPNDSNRSIDGLMLRMDYTDYAIKNRISPMGRPSEDICSCLEMLIALAKRCDHDITGEPDVDNTAYWFWRFVDNLGLRNASGNAMDKIVDTWLLRKFDKKGKGGLFPLNATKNDQRGVEIWYQMSEWLGQNWG